MKSKPGRIPKATNGVSSLTQTDDDDDGGGDPLWTIKILFLICLNLRLISGCKFIFNCSCMVMVWIMDHGNDEATDDMAEKTLNIGAGILFRE